MNIHVRTTKALLLISLLSLQTACEEVVFQLRCPSPDGNLVAEVTIVKRALDRASTQVSIDPGLFRTSFTPIYAMGTYGVLIVTWIGHEELEVKFPDTRSTNIVIVIPEQDGVRYSAMAVEKSADFPLDETSGRFEHPVDQCRYAEGRRSPTME